MTRGFDQWIQKVRSNPSVLGILKRGEYYAQPDQTPDFCFPLLSPFEMLVERCWDCSSTRPRGMGSIASAPTSALLTSLISQLLPIATCSTYCLSILEFITPSFPPPQQSKSGIRSISEKRPCQVSLYHRMASRRRLGSFSIGREMLRGGDSSGAASFYSIEKLIGSESVSCVSLFSVSASPGS
jgi:hypothetical protein